MNADDIRILRDGLKDITPEGREMAQTLSESMGRGLEDWVARQKEMYDICPENLRKDYTTILAVTLTSALAYITNNIDEALNINTAVREELIKIDSKITKNE